MWLIVGTSWTGWVHVSLPTPAVDVNFTATRTCPLGGAAVTWYCTDGAAPRTESGENVAFTGLDRLQRAPLAVLPPLPSGCIETDPFCPLRSLRVLLAGEKTAFAHGCGESKL